MTQTEYVEKLRAFLKDKEELNRLLEFREENSELDLSLYLDMAMAELNSMAPVVGFYSYEGFPIPQLVILLATVHCLISNNILNARNDLQYNNGGITVKFQDGNKYLPQIQLLLSMMESLKKNFYQMKLSVNIARGFGGCPSPYAYITGGPYEPPSYS